MNKKEKTGIFVRITKGKAEKRLNKEIKELSSSTMMGAMAAYISNPTTSKLVPMNANFGIFKDAEVYKKSEQKEKRVEAALKEIEEYKEYLDCLTK